MIHWYSLCFIAIYYDLLWFIIHPCSKKYNFSILWSFWRLLMVAILQHGGWGMARNGGLGDGGWLGMGDWGMRVARGWNWTRYMLLWFKYTEVRLNIWSVFGLSWLSCLELGDGWGWWGELGIGKGRVKITPGCLWECEWSDVGHGATSAYLSIQKYANNMF